MNEQPPSGNERDAFLGIFKHNLDPVTKLVLQFCVYSVHNDQVSSLQYYKCQQQQSHFPTGKRNYTLVTTILSINFSLKHTYSNFLAFDPH